MPRSVVFYIVTFFLLLACRGTFLDAGPVEPVEYSYRVRKSYPHDASFFTQGLVYERRGDRDVLYEGTGLEGRSTLRLIELESGRTIQRVDIPIHLFGEGVAVCGQRLFQLTWKTRIGFEYDKNTFEKLREFRYDTEGWGLTCDVKKNRLILSDGTARLYFLDPQTLRVISSVQVRLKNEPVQRLNELEYIEENGVGRVYANIWQTDWIVIIDPESGAVTGRADLSGLLGSAGLSSQADVLNGIAYDAERRRLFVTGKLWPKVFEIELIER